MYKKTKKNIFECSKAEQYTLVIVRLKKIFISILLLLVMSVLNKMYLRNPEKECDNR